MVYKFTKKHRKHRKRRNKTMCAGAPQSTAETYIHWIQRNPSSEEARQWIDDQPVNDTSREWRELAYQEAATKNVWDWRIYRRRENTGWHWSCFLDPSYNPLYANNAEDGATYEYIGQFALDPVSFFTLFILVRPRLFFNMTLRY